jgi:hypothetical protein
VGEENCTGLHIHLSSLATVGLPGTRSSRHVFVGKVVVDCGQGGRKGSRHFHLVLITPPPDLARTNRD